MADLYLAQDLSLAIWASSSSSESDGASLSDLRMFTQGAVRQCSMEEGERLGQAGGLVCWYLP